MLKFTVMKQTCADGEQVIFEATGDEWLEPARIEQLFGLIDDRVLAQNARVLASSNLAAKYKDPAVQQAVHEVFQVLFNKRVSLSTLQENGDEG